MYTRSYGSRPSITSRPIPPDYGGTALVIPQPEPEPVPPRPTYPPPSQPTYPSESIPSRPAHPPETSPPFEGHRNQPPPPEGRPPRPSQPMRRIRFTGRRNPTLSPPSLPREPDFDPRRDVQREPPPSTRRDPLGAPPFGGGAEPYEGGGQPYREDGQRPPSTETRTRADSAARDDAVHLSHGDNRLFPTLSLRQDDLLLLGLLLFLLHEQDEEDTDCRDALLLLAVLFVAGM